MKKILILLIAFCYSCFVYAQEQTWRTIPYFLKGYEAQYENLPKKPLWLGLKMPALVYLFIGGLLRYMEKANG